MDSTHRRESAPTELHLKSVGLSLATQSLVQCLGSPTSLGCLLEMENLGLLTCPLHPNQHLIAPQIICVNNKV